MDVVLFVLAVMFVVVVFTIYKKTKRDKPLDTDYLDDGVLAKHNQISYDALLEKKRLIAEKEKDLEEIRPRRNSPRSSSSSSSRDDSATNALLFGSVAYGYTDSSISTTRHDSSSYDSGSSSSTYDSGSSYSGGFDGGSSFSGGFDGGSSF